MLIEYQVLLTIVNLIDESTSKFNKTFSVELADSPILHNNYHILIQNVNFINMFQTEIDAYLKSEGIKQSSIDIDEFEVISLTDKVDVFFEDQEENTLSLSPILKCYVYPSTELLKVPTLVGIPYNSSTIIWSWPEDEEYAHYLIEEPIDFTDGSTEKIIAQIPYGQKTYTETGLDPDTAYTRRLVNYTAEQTSAPSNSVTVRTETVDKVRALSEYNIAKNYDFTSDDAEKETIDEALKAFHSGIGDGNDLKIYKQMDADFYQKFKTYIEISGRRIEREKRYAQVGFNYKVCLEAIEEIDEQEGEVTFDVEAYPREWCSLKDYAWSTTKVRVRARLKATVFLRKEDAEPKTIPSDVYEPEYKEIEQIEEVTTPPEPTIEGELRKTAIIISLDCSSSTDNTYNSSDSYTRFFIETFLACDFVDKIAGKLKELNHGSDSLDIKWGLILWAGTRNSQSSTYTYTEGMSIDSTAENFKSIIRSQITKDSYGNVVYKGKRTNLASQVGIYTCFYTGLNGHEALTNGVFSDRDVVCQIVISDGFCNKDTGSAFAYSRQGTYAGNAQTVLDSITLNYNSRLKGTVFCFLNGVNYPDNDYVGKPGVQEFGREIVSKVQSLPGIKYTWYPGDSGIILDTSQVYQIVNDTINSIQDSLVTGGVDPNPRDEWIDGHHWIWDGSSWRLDDPDAQFRDGRWVILLPPLYKFRRWNKRSLPSLVEQFEIDDYNFANIECEFDEMEFYYDPSDNNVNPHVTYDSIMHCYTPVIYDEKEQRAIVEKPITGAYLHYNGQEYNLYDLIMELLEDTPEYRAGYTKTIGTVEEGTSLPDRFLIKGLMLQNTYEWGDDDGKITDRTFGYSTFKDGWNGSVNTFTDVDNMRTTTYGDDCYLVTKNNYPTMQGFVDAIIYDNTIFPTEEVNAYDRPSAVLIPRIAPVSYGETLRCRRNINFKYGEMGGERNPSHMIEVIQKDDDIYLTGQSDVVNALRHEGDKVAVSEFTEDLVCHNDTKFFSPVLNYRFNIVDPDAKTPICEILPSCNPQSDYLHIVILHVYYAKNVYITSTTNYISEFGDDPLKYKGDPCIELTEGLYKWTLKEWKDGTDDCWYITKYIWFQSKPMIKIRDYYDELPREGFDSLYGLVNGRYRSDNLSGKQDLAVQTPKFNIPTTVTDKHKDSVRIYISIMEYHPADSLVYYRWERPLNGIDSVTGYEGNGDYVTFSSDNITYKDQEYIDIISTINYPNTEIFDNKTNVITYQLEKPDVAYDYTNYYLNISTDNSDVLPLRFPNEITFSDEGLSEIQAAFKGVVNATSKWSPRIHNGYYYLNQHEYYAYSEFDVEADFEEYTEDNFKNLNGYVSIHVNLRKHAGDDEHYSIEKTVRAELLQDEVHFKWVNGRGLTIRPVIDGKYYKKYETNMYYSPIIMFKNKLTTPGTLTVEYEFDDGSTYLPMEIRCYDLEEGQWTDWYSFANGSVPLYKYPNGTTSVMYSNAYQVRFYLQASVTNEDLMLEDYLCCYLDWEDDKSDNVTNIVTITDSMTNGPDKEAPGEYNSKILDYGCTTTFYLDYFCSNYTQDCQVYGAASDVEEELYLENITWKQLEPLASQNVFTGRYFRYKIIIPPGEKLYWLYKRFNTQQTTALLPYVTGIRMDGVFSPTDITDEFINTESFELLTDGEYHEVFKRVLDIIGSDVLAHGFVLDDIEKLEIKCPTKDMEISYDEALDNTWPSLEKLKTPINARTYTEHQFTVKKTPYIFVSKDDNDNDIIVIQGTPQQFSPITVEDEFGNPYTQLFEGSDIVFDEYRYEKENAEYMILREDFVIDKNSTKFISLKTNQYEELFIKLNDADFDPSLYETKNNLVVFNNELIEGDKLHVEYYIPHTFIADIDRINNTTTLRFYSDKDTITKPSIYTETRIIETEELVDQVAHDFINNITILNASYEASYKEILSFMPEVNYTGSFTVTMNTGHWYGFEILESYDDGENYSILASTGFDHATHQDEPLSITLDNITVTAGTYYKIRTRECSGGGEEPEKFVYSLETEENFMIGYKTGVKVWETVTREEEVTVKKKYKVFFETGKYNNKFVAENLSLNPVYRTDYKGFIYLTDEDNEVYTINIYCNPLTINAGGFDKVDISVELLDIKGNPVINRDVAIDCEYGILNIDTNTTDMNGVVHLVYESAYAPCIDKITAKVFLNDQMTIMAKEIEITNR